MSTIEINAEDAALLRLFKKYLKASQSAYKSDVWFDYLRGHYTSGARLDLKAATVTPTQEEYEAVQRYDKRVFLGDV